MQTSTSSIKGTELCTLLKANFLSHTTVPMKTSTMLTLTKIDILSKLKPLAMIGINCLNSQKSLNTLMWHNYAATCLRCTDIPTATKTLHIKESLSFFKAWCGKWQSVLWICFLHLSVMKWMKESIRSKKKPTDAMKCSTHSLTKWVGVTCSLKHFITTTY